MVVNFYRTVSGWMSVHLYVLCVWGTEAEGQPLVSVELIIYPVIRKLCDCFCSYLLLIQLLLTSQYVIRSSSPTSSFLISH